MPAKAADELNPNSVPPPLIDRRECYRARLFNSELRVRVWKIAPGTPLTHSPRPSQELRVSISNICLGGLGIILQVPESQPLLTATDRLRIEVRYQNHQVLVEGKIRAPHGQDNDFVLTGIRFDGRQSSYDFHKAQSVLSNIMGLVQREEIKAKQTAGQELAATNVAA